VYWQSKQIAAKKEFCFIKSFIMKQQTSTTTETLNKGRIMVDFSGNTLFVGIDVHKKDWQVGLYYEGISLGNFRITGSAEELIKFLKSRYKGAVLKCVYECCAWGFNLQRKLKDSGIDCIVVHAADVPGSNKEKSNKTDKVDAARLARHHSAGLLEGIYVPDEQLQKERNLIRLRKRILGDLNRGKNRLKGLLKFQGISIPQEYDSTSWSNNFITWVEQRVANDPLVKDVAGLLLEQIKANRQLLLKAEKKLRQLMSSEKYKPGMHLLQSIPGIGPLVSTLFLLEIGDINRFVGFDALNSFVGFYPGSDSSGDTEHETGLTMRKHNLLRSMLVEAAWISIKKDPAMLECYQQLTKRMKGNYAIIRIARKLLRRMRAVLLSGQGYQLGVVQ
jgi:transposase